MVLADGKIRVAVTAIGALGLFVFVRKLIHRHRHRLLSPAGKAVVVTGCDTKLGFGTAVARRLVDLGWVVFAGCLDAKKAEATLYEDDLKQSNSFHILQLDVTKQEQVDAAAKTVQNWLSENPSFRLFAVINNAGIGSFSPLEWQSMDAFESIFAVNFFGAVRVTKAFLPLIRGGGFGGRVVMVASLAGEMANPGGSAYCASKAALLALSDSLSFEVGRKFGIKVVSCLPDFYRTNIITDSEKSVAALTAEVDKLSPNVIEAYGGQAGVARMKKVLKEIIPALANRDTNPVIDALVAAVADPNPDKRYYPVNATSRFALFLKYLSPTVFDAARKKLFGG